MNPILREDFNYIAQSTCILWERLRNQSILITGASGLIGKNLVNALLYANQVYDLHLNLLVLVRNAAQFKSEFPDKVMQIIEGTVENLPLIAEKVDYIIHGASPTASAFFVSHPVDTIHTVVCGTDQLLKLANNKKVKGFIYLSSMEVYGKIDTERLLKEQDLGYLDTSSIRNCYPISKRMCENLCASYYQQYHVPAVSVRLAQTFGPGVAYNDHRVFAMMARCAILGKNILLQTKGESKHPYLYTADAITGILCVLLNGQSGQTYNLANPATYCSIYEMAQLVAKQLAESRISVCIAKHADILKYPPPSFLNLDISSVQKLGWEPKVELTDMYRRMMKTMEGKYV